MRTAAEELDRSQTFNTFLEELASKYEHDRQHRNFWQFIIRERVMLVGNPEEAESFFKQHSGAKVCPGRCEQCKRGLLKK